jgi:hypothetical protein
MFPGWRRKINLGCCVVVLTDQILASLYSCRFPMLVEPISLYFSNRPAPKLPIPVR